MELDQILVIAVWTWMYVKIYGWIIKKMKEQERREAAGGKTI